MKPLTFTERWAVRVFAYAIALLLTIVVGGLAGQGF